LDLQEVVVHSVKPTRIVGERLEAPKLIPERVMDVPPKVAPLNRPAKVTAGAS
jgi:hypothetical protein